MRASGLLGSVYEFFVNVLPTSRVLWALFRWCMAIILPVFESR